MDVDHGSVFGQATNRRAVIWEALAAGAAVNLAALAPGVVRAEGSAAPGTGPAAAGESMPVYIGTFTGPNQAQGISVHRMGGSSGALSPAFAVAADNPSFLALHPQQPYFYAVNSVNDYEGRSSGAVSAYAIDGATGNLTLSTRIPAR